MSGIERKLSKLRHRGIRWNKPQRVIVGLMRDSRELAGPNSDPDSDPGTLRGQEWNLAASVAVTNPGRLRPHPGVIPICPVSFDKKSIATPTNMKNQLVKPLLTAAALLGCGLSPVAAAVVYDATDEFSVSNGNPNDVWAYGWMDSAFTTFTTYAQTRETSSDPAWYNSTIDSWIWLNDTGSTAYGVPDGWLSLSPGNGSEAPVLRWIVPEDYPVWCR